MSFLVRRGYTPVQTPFFMRKVRYVCMRLRAIQSRFGVRLGGLTRCASQECMSECAQLEDFDEQLYKVRPLLRRLHVWQPHARLFSSVFTRWPAGVWGG
jgi:hypothetical protein